MREWNTAKLPLGIRAVAAGRLPFGGRPRRAAHDSPPPPHPPCPQVVPQLAYLRAVQALVDLPVRVSAVTALWERLWWCRSFDGVEGGGGARRGAGAGGPACAGARRQHGCQGVCWHMAPAPASPNSRDAGPPLRHIPPPPTSHPCRLGRAQKAAALDPHNVAAQPGPEGEAAAQRRDEACYAHTMAVLRLLLDRAGEGAGRVAVQGGVAGGQGWRVHREACCAHTMAVLRLLLDRAGEGVGGPGPFGHCAAFTLAFAAPIPTAPGLSLPPARIPAQP